MKETIKLDEYELSHYNGCDLKCTRNGEDWRNLIGDNLVLRMFQRIQELEKEVMLQSDGIHSLVYALSCLEEELDGKDV